MSIRRDLILILLSVITLVTFIAAIQGYKASMARASDLFDNELSLLAQSLTVLAPTVHTPTVSTQTKDKNVIHVPEVTQNSTLNTGISSVISPIIIPTPNSNFNSTIAFQLWQGKQLRLKTHNAPDQTMSQPINGSFVEGFYEDNFLGQRWRTLIKRFEYQQKMYWIIVAQPIKRRFELAEDVILTAVTPIIIAIPFLALLIWFAIQQALKPLTHLTQELTSKKANDLSLLSTRSQTSELTPVIQTLNHLFQRLEAAFERERRFASDAAHELRTPLSVLKINLHNLQNEIAPYLSDVQVPTTQSSSSEASSLETKLPAMKSLVQSVERMAHVVDQILMLNRTNPEQVRIDSKKVNFKALIAQTISELYPEINQRKQSISFNSDDVSLYGNEFSLHTLTQNLIANASKYTPESGEIIVSTQQDEGSLSLIVEDSGPGIKEEEYHRVFNRFYRVGGDQHNSSIIGCGLGLSIVQHIAQLHHAKITLSQSATLLGLKVCVVFPQMNKALLTKSISQKANDD